MTTSFHLSHEGKNYNFLAERVKVDDTLEVWRVSSRLHTNSFLALSNDRPLLHQKHEYSASYKWTVLEGEPIYRRMVSLITNLLEYHIKGLWKPPVKGKKDTKQAALPQNNPQGKLF